jgi:uncharacterized membrane-anchored protein YjiN (DUF445 family)
MSDITEEELCSFIRSLRIAFEYNKNKKDSLTWDTKARHEMGKHIKEQFMQKFGSRLLGEKVEDYFGYEGQYNRLKRTKIFSSGCYPDMYFLKPIKIAIELDHGKKGSNLKNALTKAGFDKLSKDWNRVFVIFFDESRDDKIKESLKEKQTEDILKFYKEQLSTEVLII